MRRRVPGPPNASATPHDAPTGNTAPRSRMSVFCRRALRAAAALLAVLSLGVLCFHLLFHYYPPFGVPVSHFISRQVMPRVKAPQAGAAYHPPSQLQYPTLAALVEDAVGGLRRLEVSGEMPPTWSATVATDQPGIAAEEAQQRDDAASLCALLGALVDRHRDRAVQWSAADTAPAVALMAPFCERTAAGRWQAPPDAPRAFHFHRPSLTKYGAHQWLWDSCFHIMASVALYRGATRPAAQHHASTPVDLYAALEEEEHGADPTHTAAVVSRADGLRALVSALLELRSLFAFQDLRTGFVPEMTHWHPDANQHGVRGYFFSYSDPQRRFTDITQMPMLQFPLDRLAAALDAAEGRNDAEGLPAPTPPSVPPSQPLSLSAQLLHIFAPRVALYGHYWRTVRDPRGEGLVSIVHPWESGLDASPVYDPVHGFCTPEPGAECPPRPDALYPKFIELLYRYRHRHGWDLARILAHEGRRFEVQDVGVNAVLAHSLEHAARLLEARGWALAETDTGRNGGLPALRPLPASSGSNVAAQRRFSDHLFDVLAPAGPARGIRVLSRGWDATSGRMIDLNASSTVQQFFLLLLADDEGTAAPTESGVSAARTRCDVAASLLQALRDPALFGPASEAPFPAVLKALLASDRGLTAWGTPTTARSDRCFDANDTPLMWRGPSWPTTNWFVSEGLRVMQCPALRGEARALRVALVRAWVAAVRSAGFSEYYDPITGRPMGQRGLGMSFSLLDTLL